MLNTMNSKVILLVYVCVVMCACVGQRRQTLEWSVFQSACCWSCYILFADNELFEHCCEFSIFSVCVCMFLFSYNHFFFAIATKAWPIILDFCVQRFGAAYFSTKHRVACVSPFRVSSLFLAKFLRADHACLRIFNMNFLISIFYEYFLQFFTRLEFLIYKATVLGNYAMNV